MNKGNDMKDLISQLRETYKELTTCTEDIDAGFHINLLYKTWKYHGATLRDNIQSFRREFVYYISATIVINSIAHIMSWNSTAYAAVCIISCVSVLLTIVNYIYYVKSLREHKVALDDWKKGIDYENV